MLQVACQMSWTFRNQSQKRRHVYCMPDVRCLEYNRQGLRNSQQDLKKLSMNWDPLAYTHQLLMMIGLRNCSYVLCWKPDWVL